MRWDFVQSRGFWTLILAITPSVLFLTGVTDEKVIAAILTIVGAFAGFFGVTAMRKVANQPTSRAEVMRVLERQDELIAKLDAHIEESS